MRRIQNKSAAQGCSRQAPNLSLLGLFLGSVLLTSCVESGSKGARSPHETTPGGYVDVGNSPVGSQGQRGSPRTAPGVVTDDNGNPIEQPNPLPEIDPDKPLPPRMVRLTAVQYRNTLAHILQTEGADPAVLEDFEGPFASEARTSIYSTESTSRIFTDASFEAAYEIGAAAADAIADTLTQNEASCLSQNGAGQSCFSETLARVGQTIFRTPIGAERVKEYVDLALEVSGSESIAAAVSTSIQAMLLSPSATHRLELGPEGASENERSLDPYEVASMLSYLLLDAPPDQTLLAAAADDSLLTQATVYGQAKRLLESASGLPNAVRFFREHFGYASTTVTHEDYQDMVSDSDAFVRSVLGQSKDTLSTLLTSESAYARRSTAELYGLASADVPRDGNLYTFQDGERYGVFTQPSWLLAYAREPEQETDPIRRGSFVRRRMLCEELPPIPIEGIPEIAETPEMTMRDKLAQHNQGTCAGCHTLMDPIGLALEHFDYLGRYRTTEFGSPVDSSGEVVGGGDAAGPVSNHVELMDQLAGSDRVLDCFLAHSYQYWLGVPQHPSLNSEAVQSARNAYESFGGNYTELVATMLSSYNALHRTIPD